MSEKKNTTGKEENQGMSPAQIDARIEAEEPEKPVPTEYAAKAAEARKRAQSAPEGRGVKMAETIIRQGKLPGVPWTPKGTSPMGNEIAKTPVFSPIKRGRRGMHDKTKLPAPSGYALWYSGKQLDVGDQDTYLTAIMLAKGVAPDTPVIVERSEFLRLMGRNSSGASYKWLKESFDRVASGRIYFDTPKIEGSTPLLGPLQFNKETKTYFFTVPAAALRVFGFQDFGYVDMEKRRMLGMGLAKWLQCYVVSQEKGEHRISVENLKAWSGIAGRTRQFRAILKEALAELAKVKVIQSWKLYENGKKVLWFR